MTAVFKNERRRISRVEFDVWFGFIQRGYCIDRSIGRQLTDFHPAEVKAMAAAGRALGLINSCRLREYAQGTTLDTVICSWDRRPGLG